MRIRQEQVVFVGALGVLAMLFMGTLEDSATTTRGTRGGGSPELERHPAPDVARALPRERDRTPAERSLFEPPRDTVPLPPLELEEPPRTQLPALRPPTAFGPAPALFDELLRVPAAVLATPVEGLFELEELAEETVAQGAVSTGQDLAPEDRAAQVQSYLRTYDWLRMPGYHWGRIQNEDRFGLRARPQEPILWIEFDPATGLERFPGQGAIEIARERLSGEEPFGFADTPENRIELGRLEFRGALTPGQYPRVLAFAQQCLERHPEAGNALAVAEEMFEKADAISAGHTGARLGLARVHELAFEFEKAYQIYRGLVDGGQSQNPLVLTRLAQLLARFRLFDRAEELFQEAERYGRTDWEVQAAYGRFLLAQHRPEEAAAHLEQATRFEPAEAERRAERAALRVDYATVLLHLGRLADAGSWFKKALQADAEEQRAVAGLIAIAYLEGAGDLNGSAALVSEAGLEGRGFDHLLASGLLAMSRGDWRQAKADLDLAAEADPLRAALAWRAQSFLAELTGWPEEAFRLIEQAWEADPTDVYTLIQRGRILAARDDVEGALASFQAAADQEMELPDVAAAVGEIHYEEGRHEDAERYLRGAIVLEAKLPGVHVLRGLNRLAQNEVEAAEESFRAALALERDEPTALCGVAWCAYLSGDTTEALTQYRELDDARRTLPEEDPWRVYAKRQIERLTDHVQKVVWRDNFERQQLMNDWSLDESAGPKVEGPREGVMHIEGAFGSTGRTRMKQALAAGDFVSVEARLSVSATSRVRVGIFVAVERYARGEWETRSEVTVSRNPDGRIQTRLLRGGGDDTPYVDVTGLDWPAGEYVPVRIERYGESSETRFRLSVDGLPVLEDVRVPTMGSTSAELSVGVFAEGEPGRSVELLVDDVQIVKRQR